MPNLHKNKIQTSTGEVWMDLTSDTVTPETLLKDVTAHDRSGAQIEGTVVIPTINDGTLTIQQNGTTKTTFTANQAGNVTANIETGDAYGIDMYDDTLPIDITARGDNLEDWVIYGNQEGVGEYDAESGGYVLPIITKQKSKKNMLELLADTQTINGVTFTVDKLAGTITVNGTATATTFFGFNLNLALNLPQNVELKLTGCPSGGGVTNYRIDLRDAIGGITYNNAIDNGNGATFTVTGDGCNVANIRIQNGYVCNNLVFRPMIRLSSESADFESYWTPNTTTNIYLGTSPLTEGQSLSKAQATTKDIPTYNGECVIDTSYPNKARMEIIPTDSAINIIEKLRRIGASNGSGSTIRTIYAPDVNNGIRTTVYNNRTEVQVACGQASNANGKVVFTDSKIYGGIGNPTSLSVNHFKFNDNCVGDSIGKLSSGAPLTGSEFDLNYETINLNGSTINIDDNMSIGFETIDDYTVNTIKSPYIAIATDGISLSPKSTNESSLLISRLPSGSGSELVVNSNGTVYQSSSSRDIKHNIQYIDDTESYHDALMRIKPATYVYNNDKTETAKLGMIAEDIADVMPIAALTDESGKVENYDTRAIIAVLVMEVQRLNAEIERLRGDSNAD